MSHLFYFFYSQLFLMFQAGFTIPVSQHNFAVDTIHFLENIKCGHANKIFLKKYSKRIIGTIPTTTHFTVKILKIY